MGRSATRNKETEGNVLKDVLSLRNSILFYHYDKNLSQFNRIRILRSLLFVIDSHEQYIKNVLL